MILVDDYDLKSLPYVKQKLFEVVVFTESHFLHDAVFVDVNAAGFNVQ